MSGYTYASGIMTATVTARCPECHAVRVFTWEDRHKDIRENAPLPLCCSEKHTLAYQKKCRKAFLAYRQSRGHKGITTHHRREARVGIINSAARFVANTLFPYGA